MAGYDSGSGLPNWSCNCFVNPFSPLWRFFWISPLQKHQSARKCQLKMLLAVCTFLYRDLTYKCSGLQNFYIELICCCLWVVSRLLNIQSGPSMMSLVDPHPFNQVDPHPFNWVDPHPFDLRVWIDSGHHWRYRQYILKNLVAVRAAELIDRKEMVYFWTAKMF